MTNTNYWEKLWFGSNLKGIREGSKLSTFNKFIFDELPPIRKELTNDFIWLKPFLKSNKLRNQNFLPLEEMGARNYGKGQDYSDAIKKIEKQLWEFGIELPKEISTFFCVPAINSCIRSSTDNFYEFGDFVEIISADQNYYMVHFYSDSQYCLLWYICFRQDGSHFIVASPKLYGHEDSVNYNQEFLDYVPSIGYICANTFKEFIYHYNMEQRIWFKINWYEEEFEEEEQDYLNYYLKK